MIKSKVKLPKNILSATIALLTLIVGFFSGNYYNQQKTIPIINFRNRYQNY